jgi:RNA polymerase sigma-70 factor (ECF subfamily)
MSLTPPLQSQDELAVLMERIGTGDQDAYTVLVRRVSGRMFSLAHHMLGATGEAEEIVQEVCLRLWQRPGSWRPDRGNLKSWLDRVTVNACLDRLRRRKWDGGAVDENWQDHQPDAVAVMVKQEEQAAVRHAILQLPPRQRAALLLVEYRGLRQDAAAKDMGLSVEALESLLARGRRKLRALLAPVIGLEQGERHVAG